MAMDSRHRQGDVRVEQSGEPIAAACRQLCQVRADCLHEKHVRDLVQEALRAGLKLRRLTGDEAQRFLQPRAGPSVRGRDVNERWQRGDKPIALAVFEAESAGDECRHRSASAMGHRHALPVALLRMKFRHGQHRAGQVIPKLVPPLADHYHHVSCPKAQWRRQAIHFQPTCAAGDNVEPAAQTIQERSWSGEILLWPGDANAPGSGEFVSARDDAAQTHRVQDVAESVNAPGPYDRLLCLGSRL